MSSGERVFQLVSRWDGDPSPQAVRVIAVTSSCPPALTKARPGDRWSIEDFILVRKLGQGYASSVYLAVCKFSKESVIIKVTKKAGLSMLNDYQIRREIAIHSRLSHVNLCALHAAFEDNEAYYAVQEHCAGGDLFQKMQQRRTVFTEKECIIKILLPLLKALYYMHSRGVIHRDIKPENILLSAREEVKLGDFGLSIAYLDERPVTRLGTTEYMAPEILLCHTKDQPMDHKQGMEFYGSSADVWAVGVLTYELLVGSLPFQGKDRFQISRSIMTDQPKYPTWLSPGAQDFVSKALAKLPSMRPSMKDLMRHPWISAYAAMAPAPQPPKGVDQSKTPLQTAKSLGAMTMHVERSVMSVSVNMQNEGDANTAGGDHEIELQKPRAAKVGAPSFTAKTMSPGAIQARMQILQEANAKATAAHHSPQASAPSTPPVTSTNAAPAAEEKRDRPVARSVHKSETEGVMQSAQSFSVHALQMNRSLAKEIMEANKSMLESNMTSTSTPKGSAPSPGPPSGKTPGSTSQTGRATLQSSDNSDASKKKTVSFMNVDGTERSAAPDKGGRHAMAAATSFVFPNHYHPSIEFGIDEEREVEEEEVPTQSSNSSSVVRTSAVDTKPRAAVQSSNLPSPTAEKKGFMKMFSWKKGDKK